MKNNSHNKININPGHSCQPRDFHSGFDDKFATTEPLDLQKCKTVNDLVTSMSKTSFGARTIGEAADVFEKMVKDKDCFVVLTISGAMTIAKMGLVVCDMIDNDMIHAIVSTGALMAHGFVEGTGKLHFKYDGKMNDRELYYAGYDRVYDTLELEKNLDDVASIVDKTLDVFSPNESVSSWRFHQELGKYLSQNGNGRSILKSAYKKNVPVIVPAFTDSELGLDFAIHNRKLKGQNKEPLHFDPFLDLDYFAELLAKQKKLGIFTVGGGVPRNWTQQIGPYLDLINFRLYKGKGHFIRFNYGVRICPEPVNYGGLSGCTYSEGVSWGKFIPQEEGGRYAEVFCDATIGWPIIVKAVLERLKK